MTAGRTKLKASVGNNKEKTQQTADVNKTTITGTNNNKVKSGRLKNYNSRSNKDPIREDNQAHTTV